MSSPRRRYSAKAKASAAIPTSCRKASRARGYLGISGKDATGDVRRMPTYSRKSPRLGKGGSAGAHRRFGETVVDAVGEWDRLAKETRRDKAAAQPVEAFLGQNRVATPHPLRLVARKRPGQYAAVEAGEVRGDCRRQGLNRLLVDPALGAVDRPGHAAERLGIGREPRLGRREHGIAGAPAGARRQPNMGA